MKPSLSLALLLVTLAACGKDEPVSASRPTGDLSGRVILNHVRGYPLSDAGGVLVEIEGTSFSTTSVDSAEFDANGYWTIRDLPAGTYTIRYSKTGYGEMREFGVVHVGYGNAYRPVVTLGAYPQSAAITDLSVSTLDTSRFGAPYRVLRVTATADTLQPASQPGYWEFTPMALFIGKSDRVSFHPGDHQLATFISGGVTTSSLIERLLWPLPYGGELQRAGFKSGDTIYLVAYSMSRFEASSTYYDPILRRTLYTSFAPTPSNVVSAVIP